MEPRGSGVVIILVGVGLTRPGGEDSAGHRKSPGRLLTGAWPVQHARDGQPKFFLRHGPWDLEKPVGDDIHFTCSLIHSTDVHRGPSGGPKLCQGAVRSLPDMTAPSWILHTGEGTGHCYWVTQTRQPCWRDQALAERPLWI